MSRHLELAKRVLRSREERIETVLVLLFELRLLHALSCFVRSSQEVDVKFDWPRSFCLSKVRLQPWSKLQECLVKVGLKVDEHESRADRKVDGIHIDMGHLKSGEVNLGTSIMAINFRDGVILGADSRTTTGAYIANRVTDKLTRVHDTIWCCRSGSAADTQAVADIVQYHLEMYGVNNDEPPTTQTAAAIFQELCYDNKDMLSAGIIIAGWDHRHGGQVYSIPLGGSLHKQDYAIGGSGSTYIYGYCDANWREDMTEEEGVKFVKGALREAIKWDGSSGGVIRMVVLTAAGAVRHLYLPDRDYSGCANTRRTAAAASINSSSSSLNTQTCLLPHNDCIHVVSLCKSNRKARLLSCLSIPLNVTDIHKIPTIANHLQELVTASSPSISEANLYLQDLKPTILRNFYAQEKPAS
ncbi:hypothetical protein MRB53_037712 [Persea americana]|nr:hypothetical protein MRB53_037712 [Persea americana]